MLDNLLFTPASPVLLDWARCAKGPAALDLADVVFTIAPPDELEPLLDRYLDDLNGRQVHELDSESLRRQLGTALLRKFTIWTLGVARWQPSSAREARMIELSIERAFGAVTRWLDIDPDLFREVAESG